MCTEGKAVICELCKLKKYIAMVNHIETTCLHCMHMYLQRGQIIWFILNVFLGEKEKLPRIFVDYK